MAKENYVHDIESHEKIGKQRQIEQSKSTYYYQGIIVALIAFSINLTIDKCLSIKIGFLFIAIVSWLYAFYCGHKNRMDALCSSSAQQQICTDEGLRNYDYLKAERDRYGKRASIFFSRQFKFMFIGVVCFIVWYVIGIINV